MRVRFAPSPTGYLHVGVARAALFNWLLARQQGGVFVLRVEDTDHARSTEAHTEAILHGLSWLGLDWDEGPIFQSDGLAGHQAAALRLLAEGKAYRDFTTTDLLKQEAARRGLESVRRLPRELSTELDPAEVERRVAAGESFAIRFRVPEGETAWDDLLHGELSFANADIEDLVLLRSDGSPTYNLAAVSDDADERITHVIRGDDHISNTPKQILLYRALGHAVPRFGHLPMILGPDGGRLSKRHGATAVQEYEDQGILPEALFNFLALLGWNPGDDREVMSKDEIVAEFSLERVQKKSAVFDNKKLSWMNGQHLARVDSHDLVSLVIARFDARGVASDRWRGREGWLVRLVDLLKVRARNLDDLAAMAEPYLSGPVDYEADSVAKHWAKEPATVAERIAELRGRLDDTPWERGALNEVTRSVAEALEIPAGKLIHPVRVAVTGRQHSPGIFDVLEMLGKERTLARLDRALRHLHTMK
tara:strand:+ start:10681 stop:12114 length:1434 start_codon:yes stop_codon:yes gene_type:complete